MNIFGKYKLEFVVFLCGASGMVMELVGSRVVSPYFGSSLYVWTSLIGVILGSLSLGYYWGGRISDKRQDTKFLFDILILASLFVALTAFTKEVILARLAIWFAGDMGLGSIVAVIVLFSPASIILGIVSPYAAKLKLEALKTSGSVVGNLYAISTFGSIAGTFFAGFYLIPFMGNTNILYLISGVLAITAIFTFLGPYSYKNLGLLVLPILLFVLSQQFGLLKMKIIADIDSQYGRILVKELGGQSARKLRYLSTDNRGWESAMFLYDPDELVFDYTKAYRISNFLGKEVKSALMLGGAANSYPRDFLKSNKTGTIDIVEIDPRMTEVARKYFNLVDEPRMKIFHEDARTYVQNTKNKYDVVFLDAFMGVTPPSHLTTMEFMADINNLLNDDGVLLINMLSAVRGWKSGFFQAEANTIRSVFPYLDVYMIQKEALGTDQNLLVVAQKRKMDIEVTDPELKELLAEKMEISETLGNGKILTDDHAPVEFLTRNMFN